MGLQETYGLICDKVYRLYLGYCSLVFRPRPTFGRSQWGEPRNKAKATVLYKRIVSSIWTLSESASLYVHLKEVGCTCTLWITICPLPRPPPPSPFSSLFQKLTPGTLLLGAVLEIHEYEVIFSLPFNMRGTVAISDVSDPITQLVESEAEREDSDREEAEKVSLEEQVCERAREDTSSDQKI